MHDLKQITKHLSGTNKGNLMVISGATPYQMPCSQIKSVNVIHAYSP